VIYDIIEDDKGNLWMSTNNGLAKFNPKTEEFKNYDVNDGLQSNEFNTGTACKTKKGEMFFGGIGGFNSFYPENIRDNPYLPSIVITDFRIFNRSVPVGKMEDGRTILEKSITETDEIVLSYRDNVFSFEFVALHYATPEKNEYAYCMEGLEKEWNYVGTRRYVTYSGLSPGTYTFKVRGSNNDGVWNEDGTSLKIKIIPPFWRTWWFYLLCAISIAFIIAAIFIYQINRIKKQKEEEERLKVITDVGQVLEHGRATIYRRKIDSDKYDYMGNGIRDLTGYGPEEYSIAMWKKIVQEIELVGEHSDLTMDKALEQMHDGRLDNFVMDFSVQTKSGEIHWVRDITTALRNESGDCYAYLGIIFDITDRKLVEQKLAEKGKSIERTLFEHTADPIMIFDKETYKFLDCNKAVLRGYGYSKEEMRSMTPFNLHPPGDLGKVKKNIDLRNVDSPNHYRHVTKDGRNIDVEILTDETVHKGRPAWISIVRNITERKQAELKLTQLMKELRNMNRDMKNDLEMAREVQLAFLEKQPSRFPENIPVDKSSLQFCHRYIPATTLAGDFFNIIPISKDKVGILICDVMGHGARASLLTAYIQGLIGEIMPVAPDPGVFMEKLNAGINSIMYQFEKGIFATVFYLVADIKTGQMLYTNAGHPIPLLLRNGKSTVDKLFTEGNEVEPALGLFKNFFYSVFMGQMKEDDIILFYTDGVYEVDNKEGELFGQERLLNSIQSRLPEQPDQLLDGILHEMNGFSKSEDFRDDVCMVAMQVKNM
jgi:PAS domain S-box-containing protein